MERDQDFDESDDGVGQHSAPAATGNGDLSHIFNPAVTSRPATRLIETPDWKGHLHRTPQGDIKPTLYNVALIVQNDPRIRGCLRYNEFRQRIVLVKEPMIVRRKSAIDRPICQLQGPIWCVPDPEEGAGWTDVHEYALRLIIEAPTTQGGYGVKVSMVDVIAAVNLVAHRNYYHPVRDMLLGFQWDGIARLDRLFVDYLGCPDDIYHRHDGADDDGGRGRAHLRAWAQVRPDGDPRRRRRASASRRSSRSWASRSGSRT